MLVSGQSIYVGSSDIFKVYQGEDLIWQAFEPVTGDGYYYYYQSMNEWDINVIAANYSNVKQQGSYSSASTEFSFIINQNYSGGVTTRSVVTFALPYQIQLQKVIASGQDITHYFNADAPKIITLDGITYKLYYRGAIWGNDTLTVTVT